MINPNRVIAAGTGALLALGSLSACSNLGPQEVRNFGWVDTIESEDPYYAGGRRVRDHCVVTDGSEIKVAEGIATIVRTGSLLDGVSGTSCPKGAQFVMDAEMQSDLERATGEQDTLEKIAKEANRLSDEAGSPTSIRGSFDTVNEPTQTYRSILSGTFETKMEFGDSCSVQPSTPVSVLGELSTGDYAARVEQKYELGASCPQGAIIVVPSDELHR